MFKILSDDLEKLTDSKLYWVKVISYDSRKIRFHVFVFIGLKVCNYKLNKEKKVCMWKNAIFVQKCQLAVQIEITIES